MEFFHGYSCANAGHCIIRCLNYFFCRLNNFEDLTKQFLQIKILLNRPKFFKVNIMFRNIQDKNLFRSNNLLYIHFFLVHLLIILLSIYLLSFYYAPRKIIYRLRKIFFCPNLFSYRFETNF